MDYHTINESPYHTGGRYGPGQEIYYAQHRFRLWRLFCIVSGTTFRVNDVCRVYKQKKEVLQRMCQSLGLDIVGTNKELIARLDMYSFTPAQIQAIGMWSSQKLVVFLWDICVQTWMPIRNTHGKKWIPIWNPPQLWLNFMHMVRVTIGWCLKIICGGTVLHPCLIM